MNRGGPDPLDPTDPRRRFDVTVEDYRRYRPDYPDAVVAWIGEATGVGPPGAVIDLGSGTGLASRRLAAAGYDVVGVEPNEAMRAAAAAAGGGPRYVAGEAARTGLGDASADLAIAAQAFHWFDLPSTFAELRRVVRTRWCVALWNLRDPSVPQMAAYEALVATHCGEYASTPKAAGTIERLLAHPEVHEAREVSLPHAQQLDREGLRGRAWSSSYVAHGVRDRRAFDAALDALFDAWSDGDRLAFGYRTRALAFRV